MNRCEKCDSQHFYESDGFYFCSECQTQSQGFAKQIFNQEENDFGQLREVRVGNKVDGRKNHKKASKLNQDGSEQFLEQAWTSAEAFNEVYLGLIEDFLTLLSRNNYDDLTEDLKVRFRSIAMQIWFKYLRESDIAFVRNEHLEKRNKIHPLARYRDNYILSNDGANKDDDGDEIKMVDFVPNYCHGTPTVNKNLNIRSYSKNYRLKMERTDCRMNQTYFNDDFYSESYRDPRFQFRKQGFHKRFNKLKPLVNRMVVESATKNKNNDDEFAKLVQRLSAADSPNVDPDPSEVEEVEKSDMKNLNQEPTIPTISKLVSQMVPIEEWKDTSSMAFTREMINRPKLLAFLYITIRLFNFKIFASDLIRWCMDDDIRYLDTFSHFQKKRRIMWVDHCTYKNSCFPNYDKFLSLTRDMIIHCHIEPESFPVPDMYYLIRRYLKDLNLPRGLILIIKKRYGAYLESQTGSGTFLKDLKICTPYEVHAMVVILSALRDLFDLNGPGEHYQSLFATNEPDLFQWSEWFCYSFVRFNLIKAYFLNIKPSHTETVDLDEILTRNHLWMEFFKENQIVSERPIRSTFFGNRVKMQSLFEDLFFGAENFEWKDQCSKHIPCASLYPLTALTDKIIARTGNDDLKRILNKDFRCKRITPYVCEHNLFFHRRPTLFHFHPKMEGKWREQIECSFGDSFKLLWEMVIFSTNAYGPIMNKYFYYAEKSAYPELFPTAKSRQPIKQVDEFVI